MEKKAERERERESQHLERLERTNKGFFLVAILIDKRCCPRSVSAFKMWFNNHFLSLSLFFLFDGLWRQDLAVREMGKHGAKKAEKSEKKTCLHKEENKGEVGKTRTVNTERIQWWVFVYLINKLGWGAAFLDSFYSETLYWQRVGVPRLCGCGRFAIPFSFLYFCFLSIWDALLIHESQFSHLKCVATVSTDKQHTS